MFVTFLEWARMNLALDAAGVFLKNLPRPLFRNCWNWCGLVLSCSVLFLNGQSLAQSTPAPIRSIDLKECLSTIEQPELTKLRNNPNKVEGKLLGRVYPALASLGASNLFIVDGKDLEGIVNSTRSILTGSRSADFPFGRENHRADGPFWLFVHFGSDAREPPIWTIQSVTVEHSKIIVTVKEIAVQLRNNDLAPYSTWVPLGGLANRPYELQIVDADSNEIRFMRRTRGYSPN